MLDPEYRVWDKDDYLKEFFENEIAINGKRVNRKDFCKYCNNRYQCLTDVTKSRMFLNCCSQPQHFKEAIRKFRDDIKNE